MACGEFGCKTELISFQYSNSDESFVHPPAGNLRRNISERSGSTRSRETHTSDSLFNHPLGIYHGLFFTV